MGYGEVMFLGLFQRKVFIIWWIYGTILTVWIVAFDDYVGQVDLIVKMNQNVMKKNKTILNYSSKRDTSRYCKLLRQIGYSILHFRFLSIL